MPVWDRRVQSVVATPPAKVIRAGDFAHWLAATAGLRALGNEHPSVPGDNGATVGLNISLLMGAMAAGGSPVTSAKDG